MRGAASTILITLSGLVLLAAPAWAAPPGTNYRLTGQDLRRGPCTGTLTIDGTAVELALDFAGGLSEERRGTAHRVGALLVVELKRGPVRGATGALSGAPSHRARAPLRLTIRAGADRATLLWTGGDRGVASGPRLDWTREADLDPARPAAGRLGRILAHFRTAAQRGTFRGRDQKEIAWASFPSAGLARAALVVSTGRTESYEKYPELIYDLRQSGYSLFFIDHRGQGRSERLLAAGDPVGSAARQRQHVARWSDYVDDLKQFVDQVVRPRAPSGKIVGLGHSMGGGILTDLAIRHPQTFSALVLSAPMHQLELSWLARRFVNLQVLLGRGERYARDEGPWIAGGWSAFATNTTTSSPVRYQIKQQLWDPRPDLWIGGPTYRWVQQVAQGTKRLRAQAHRLTTPTLLFQAGAESFVANAGQDEVARKAPHLTKLVVPNGKHELLFEADPIRHRVLTRVIRFLDRHTR